MFEYIREKLKVQALRRENQRAGEEPEPEPFDRLSDHLSENLQVLQGVIGSNADIKVRQFEIGMQKNVRAALVFIEGVFGKMKVSQKVSKMLAPQMA